jgi:hypothetical protein
MHKLCSDVCKLRPCLDKESNNSTRMHTNVIAELQQQYSQTELIFWITLVETAASSSLYLQEYTGQSCSE